MNFDDVIAKHIQWKMTLRQYLNGTKKLEVSEADLSRDDMCALGKWILADGKKYAQDDDFKSLVSLHKAFHQAAGKVVNLSQSNKKAASDFLDGSEYTQASSKVISALAKLRDKVEKKAA